MSKESDLRRAGASVVADAICTACGCMCDDIDLIVADNQVIEADRACSLGQDWFRHPAGEPPPPCLVDGRPASVAAGVERAAKILSAARYPLVYGLEHATCEAQRLAVSIADWIGGTVDTPTSREHGPSGVAFQGVGEVTASLGEIANRGDLVVFWGCDPVKDYPRHLERYSLWPRGMFVPNGRDDRTCVVVDVRLTETAKLADLFLKIEPQRDFEALWILRALARSIDVDPVAAHQATGVPLEAWRDLAERMKRARFGVILIGTGLMSTAGRYLNLEASAALVRDMNAYTRFVARTMRPAGNTAGADNVLAWRSGFPFGVNFSRGYPRFNPGEFTADEILSRREADAALIVGCDPAEHLSAAALEHLEQIDRVTLHFEPPAISRGAAVSFATAKYGLCAPGTVYRMDEIPLSLRPACRSLLASDAEILALLESQILARLAPAG